MDHSTALRAVIDAIAVMAAEEPISEDNVVLQLQSLGYSRIEAEMLNVFVPSAFSWPVLKKLGLKSLPNKFVALDKSGAEVELPIADFHYFTAALAVAYEVFQHGWTRDIPRRTYELVAGRSAEMNIVDKVYNEGGSVEGASLQPLRLSRLGAEELQGS